MIPAEIDATQIINDLNRWGWKDYKIEIICGLGSGYVCQLRTQRIKLMTYQRAARLYNFWEEELGKQAKKQVEQIDLMVTSKLDRCA